jgi:hypothetical protein
MTRFKPPGGYETTPWITWNRIGVWSGGIGIAIVTLIFAAQLWMTSFGYAPLTGTTGLGYGLALICFVGVVKYCRGKLRRHYGKQELRARLAATGTRIQASFKQAKADITVATNEGNPYTLIAIWTDPNTGKTRTFSDGDFWPDPTPVLKGGTVDVLLDPENPELYCFDFPFVRKEGLDKDGYPVEVVSEPIVIEDLKGELEKVIRAFIPHPIEIHPDGEPFLVIKSPRGQDIEINVDEDTVDLHCKLSRSDSVKIPRSTPC